MITTLLIASSVIGMPKLGLEGTWTSKVQFTTGIFSSVKDLEFMLVFNRGGTMVESSNYDEAPPVPPAYGIWRRIGTRRFEAKYVFYTTNAPANFKIVTDGGGWSPSGKGILIEQIQLAKDENSYRSTLRMKVFDVKGKLLETSMAKALGQRMTF